jgi:hypothetical protein
MILPLVLIGGHADNVPTANVMSIDPELELYYRAKKLVKKRGAAFATRYSLVRAVTSQGKPSPSANLPV